jgi:hypothetical protein
MCRFVSERWMVNRHLFPNNFSVDQAKTLLPAIIQNGPPTVSKDTHRTEAVGAKCVNRTSGMARQSTSANVRLSD